MKKNILFLMCLVLGLTLVSCTPAGESAKESEEASAAVSSDTASEAAAEVSEEIVESDVDPNYKPPEVITSGDCQYSFQEDKESVVLVKYTGKEDDIVIPSEIDGYPVTEIGAEAFRHREMKSLSVPDGVRRIGQQAFEYCVISDALQLPENVVIMKDAFSYAELPSVLTIPSGAAVESCAFSYNETIRKIVIEPEAVIKSRAFGYCYKLNRIVCAQGSLLQAKAFEYCSKLETVVFCGEVNADEDIFYHCADIGVTEAEADEFDTQKQADPASAEPSPAEPEIIKLEIEGSPASRDGVTVTLDEAWAEKNPKTGGFRYTLNGTLENNSDEGIMQIIYTFALIDAEGEEFRSFGIVYDGEDTAIPPHTKIGFSHDDIKWGKQSVPASVRIGISSVKTEAELPPAHVPQKGEYLYQALENEKLKNIKEEPPVELTFHVDEGGYGRTATFVKGAGLEKAIELFCAIQIGDESNEWVTDNYNWIGLTWEDGTTTGISLNLYNLEYGVHSTPHVYELENLGAFWAYCEAYLKED